MDIYQRMCKKEGLLNFNYLKENEIEILDAECAEEIEEEQELSQAEEKLDLDILQTNLECMKRWIQKLQLRLNIELNECPPANVCTDFETCSENKDICALQKGQYKLQCQINELICCCKCAKEQIKNLHEGMCQKTTEIQKLQNEVETLKSWKMTLEHEFGICIERFEYLKHVKAEWADVVQVMDEHKKRFEDLKNKYVSKESFERAKSQASYEIMALKELFKDVLKRQSELREKSFGDPICSQPLMVKPSTSGHDYMDENN